MSNQPRKVARIVGVVAGLALVGLFVSASRTRTAPDAAKSAAVSAIDAPPLPPASADVIALLGGLRVGDDVAGCKVASITAPQAGTVFVFVRQGDGQFATGIVRKGTSKSLPPVTTDSYELGYGQVQGSPRADALPAVTEAIANRLRATEKTVPVPAGM